MKIEINPMTANHWSTVREIYLEGIAGGNATFEIVAPSWREWDVRHLDFARIVAVVDGEVKGWAALSPVSSRAVYRGVAENSVYVAPDARGRGIGRLMLQNIIIESEANGVWTLQNSIFPENFASINLHLSCGFREVGYRERVAQLNGVWRNTVFMERRSSITGMFDMPAGQ